MKSTCSSERVTYLCLPYIFFLAEPGREFFFCPAVTIMLGTFDATEICQPPLPVRLISQRLSRSR